MSESSSRRCQLILAICCMSLFIVANNTSLVVLGVALIGTVAVVQVHGPMRQGFSKASHAGWAIVAGCGLIILILAVLTTGERAKASAERTAALLPDTYSAAVAPRAKSGTSDTEVADPEPVDTVPADTVPADTVPPGTVPMGVTSNVGADGSPDTTTR